MSISSGSHGRHRNIDYAFWAKAGFLFGLVLLLAGASGEIIGHSFFEPIPAWEVKLFFYSEVLGIIIGFFSVIVFGIALPLTE
jgi:hypothetical protein